MIVILAIATVIAMNAGWFLLAISGRRAMPSSWKDPATLTAGGVYLVATLVIAVTFFPRDAVKAIIDSAPGP